MMLTNPIFPMTLFLLGMHIAAYKKFIEVTNSRCLLAKEYNWIKRQKGIAKVGEHIGRTQFFNGCPLP